MRITLRHRVTAGLAALAVAGGMVAVVDPPARAATSSVAARSSIAPDTSALQSLLGEPPSNWLIKQVLAGVVSAAAGTAFGEVLGTFVKDPTAEALAVISAKLDKLQKTLDEVKDSVSRVERGLSFTRFSAQRDKVSHLLSVIDKDILRIKEIADPTVPLAVKNATKADLEHSLRGIDPIVQLDHLDKAILAATGDDITGTAFLAEYHANRFYSDTSYQHAKSIVEYYLDEASALLLLYSEDAIWKLGSNPSADALTYTRNKIKAEAQKQEKFIAAVRAHYPHTPTEHGAWSIDTKTLDGKALFYYNAPEKVTVESTLKFSWPSISWNGTRFNWKYWSRTWGTTSSLWKQYARIDFGCCERNATWDSSPLPTFAQYQHLISGRAGNQTGPQYLKSNGFTPALGCGRSAGDSQPPTTPAEVGWLYAANPDDDGLVAIAITTGQWGNPNYGCVNLWRKSLSTDQALVFASKK